jgi:hypothetical protein
MTTGDDNDDKMLDDLFQVTRSEMPAPSDDLMARIMGDADQVADGWEQAKAKPAQASGGGWLRSLLDAVGGWPAASGIVTAGMVGLIVGISPPQTLSDFAAGYIYGTSDSYLVDPYDGFGFAADEG